MRGLDFTSPDIQQVVDVGLEQKLDKFAAPDTGVTLLGKHQADSGGQPREAPQASATSAPRTASQRVTMGARSSTLVGLGRGHPIGASREVF